MKRLLVRLAAFTVIVSAATMPVGPSAHATMPGGNGKIAFFRWRGGYLTGTAHQIVTMDPDGTHVAALTNSPTRSSDWPSWSPDGMQIAYATSFVDRFGIPLHSAVRIMDADGSNSHIVIGALKKPGFFERITWSPDGTMLAVEWKSWSYDTGHIMVVGVDGSGLTSLTHSHHSDFYPDWSPDGATIAFLTFDETPPDYPLVIATMQRDGSARTPVITRHYPGMASWAPDGNGFAVDQYVRNPAGSEASSDITLVDTSGSRTANLTSTYHHSEFSPCFSPNGLKVAYLRQYKIPDIWVVPVAGGPAVQLTNTPQTSEGGISWQPT